MAASQRKRSSSSSGVAVKRRRQVAEPEVDEDVVACMRERVLDGVCDSWQAILTETLKEPDGSRTLMRLSNELSQGKPIFPTPENIFNAFKLTPFNDVKVVIIGQDPYHNYGQAMGLAFSVPATLSKLPPSLIRILQEVGVTADCGDLTSWAKQGVFLLNPVLTVEKGQPGSHRDWGWQRITCKALSQLSARTRDRRLVFLLWGNKAAELEELIDKDRHLILKASHPSPLATKGNFLGCRHFELANECLTAQGLTPIDWSSISKRTQQVTLDLCAPPFKEPDRCA